MTKKNKERLLKMWEGLYEFLKTPTPDSYWEKEAKMIKKLKEENDRINKSIQMTPEKFREPFTI